MDINLMSRRELLNIPQLKWDEDKAVFDCLIIVPSKGRNKLHESGYRAMTFIAVKNNVPICKISGCSDVVHIDGIGGYGKGWIDKYGTALDKISPSGWSIDCLAKSGLLRIWPSSNSISCGPALSSFEIYAEPKSKQMKQIGWGKI